MKSSFDCSHVKSVRAWALVHNGEFAGRVVANFSDNPNGSVCTVTVSAWNGPLSEWSSNPVTAKAGGYGYCKFSSSFAQAIRKMDKLPENIVCNVDGAGSSSVVRWLESHGYTVFEVL